MQGTCSTHAAPRYVRDGKRLPAAEGGGPAARQGTFRPRNARLSSSKTACRLAGRALATCRGRGVRRVPIFCCWLVSRSACCVGRLMRHLVRLPPCRPPACSADVGGSLIYGLASSGAGLCGFRGCTCPPSLHGAPAPAPAPGPPQLPTCAARLPCGGKPVHWPKECSPPTTAHAALGMHSTSLETSAKPAMATARSGSDCRKLRH